MDTTLADEVFVDSRRADSRNYCYRFISESDVIDKISILLPPSMPTSSENYLSLQCTTNNSWDKVNSCYHRIFNIIRNCQSQALVKENQDAYYANA